MSENKQSYCIPAGHPCLAGHFPGNPIVPGVVLLNYVQQQILASLPDCRIMTLSQAKFLHPLHPEQTFSIELIQSSAQHIKFMCTHHNDILVSGLFILEHE